MYGTVQDAVVMKDPVSRRSRGFGFITFTDINAVDNALAHEPHTIDARKVGVDAIVHLLSFLFSFSKLFLLWNISIFRIFEFEYF